MEVIYQVRGRRMYVRGFQLIRGIQHAILQICVCVRRGYANERVCEERVKLGECVRGVFVRIRYCTDVFFVVDVWSCVCYELFPRWTYIGINPYEWTRYSSFLKTHERKHVYTNMDWWFWNDSTTQSAASDLSEKNPKFRGGSMEEFVSLQNSSPWWIAVFLQSHVWNLSRGNYCWGRPW